MYCKNCGKQMDDNALFCSGCGFKKGEGKGYCADCGGMVDLNSGICKSCGRMCETPYYNPQGMNNAQAQPIVDNRKSKIAAGLFGIFLGSLGIHNFYLGFKGKAIAQLLMTLLSPFSCGISAVASGIWSLIEGILIFAGNIDKDAEGNSLKD